MMKYLKSVALAIVGMFLAAFIAFIPINVKAATITNGQSVKLLNQGKQFYKFTLEEDALVQIKWVNNAGNTAEGIIYIDKTRNNMLCTHFIQNKSGRVFFAMKKGTYYLDLYESNTPTTTVTINWTLASKYDTNNYSAKKAQTLNPDTVVRIPQVHDHDYNRWYKIKVTKAHKVTITMSYGNASKLFFFTSNLDNLSSRMNLQYGSDYKTMTTSEKLAVGTYYIMVPMIDPYSPIGDACAFKWN